MAEPMVVEGDKSFIWNYLLPRVTLVTRLPYCVVSQANEDGLQRKLSIKRKALVNLPYRRIFEVSKLHDWGLEFELHIILSCTQRGMNENSLTVWCTICPSAG